MPKDLYLGFAAGMGVMAVELAARGFEGRRDVTSHFEALSDYEPELLTRGLGSEYFVGSGGLLFKLHSAAGMTLPSVYAFLKLRRRDEFGPEDVEAIEVQVSHRGAKRCAEVHPPNPIAAKSSIPYVLSAVLTSYDEIAGDPRLTQLYTDEKLASPARRALAERVRVLPSDDFQRGQEHEWPVRFPARVVVKLQSGRTLIEEADVFPEGSRMTDEQVAAKFREVAGRILRPEQVSAAIEKVLNVDRGTPVSELLQAVRI